MWRLKDFRKRAGMSQRELAEKMGVSQVAVSKWETLQTNPNVEQIIELAKLLGVPVQYLFDTDDIEYRNAGPNMLEPELQIALHALKGAGYSDISEEGRAKLFQFVEQLRVQYPAHPEADAAGLDSTDDVSETSGEYDG